MQRLGLVLFLSLLPAAASAQPTATSDPLAPVAWLAGGTWKAEVPNPKGGANTHIEQRMESALGGKAIQFVTKFDGATQYEGFFVWDAAKKQIVFTYPSADGDVTSGVASASPDGVLMDFTIDDASGTATHYQVRIKRSSADDYTWTLFSSGANDAWTPMFQVKYHREH